MFDKTTICEELVPPTVRLPRLSVEGARDATGGVAVEVLVPVPVRLTL